nr:MAG TPA: hypothetical protein [Caudoviricetes sp.]
MTTSPATSFSFRVSSQASRTSRTSFWVREYFSATLRTKSLEVIIIFLSNPREFNSRNIMLFRKVYFK